MLLQLSTWQEIDAYLERSRGIVIPIGSTEQHGPNGFIGTDALCPEIVARGMDGKIDVVVAPTLSIGMAQHHLGFSGSITLRPSTLIAVVRDVVQSLVRHGFERCYFLNGHGGNIATVNAAFSEIYADTSFNRHAGNEPGCGAGSATGSTGGGFAGCRRSCSAARRAVATPSEVSLTFYGYPGAIKSAPMTPRIAPTGPILDAADYRRRFPDGRIGSDPSLATPEAGEKLFHAAVEDAVEDYKRFLSAQ